MPKTYRGVRDNGGAHVLVDDGAGGIHRLDPRLDLMNHSPTGLTWGYAGSGPSQTALAILADAASPAVALNLYQRFKLEVVSRLSYEGWVLSEQEVVEWITRTDEGAAMPSCTPFRVALFDNNDAQTTVEHHDVANITEAFSSAEAMLRRWGNPSDRIEWNATRRTAQLIGMDGRPSPFFAVIQEQ